MRHAILALGLALCLPLGLPLAPLPAAAQQAGDSDAEEGASLIEEGVRLLFRGLIDRLGPALTDMADKMDDFAIQAEPILRDLARMMDDVQNYHAPEVLPNGDILIRRKQPGEEIEL